MVYGFWVITIWGSLNLVLTILQVWETFASSWCQHIRHSNSVCVSHQSSPCTWSIWSDSRTCLFTCQAISQVQSYKNMLQKKVAKLCFHWTCLQWTECVNPVEESTVTVKSIFLISDHVSTSPLCLLLHISYNFLFSNLFSI